MTSATEVLRRLLDERGVEHEDDEDVTRFFGPDGFEVVMQEDIDGKLDCLTPLYLTPEQAIAATLGTETCHIKPWKMERDTGFFDCMECSECGYVTDVSEWAKATYCAGCGRRVEQ